MSGSGPSLLARLLLPVMLALGCGEPAPLTVEMPLHLEDHLDAATITGSDLPADPPQAVEWRFDQPQPDWKVTPIAQWNPTMGTALMARDSGALRITLTDRTRAPDGVHVAGLHVDLPDWDRSDWADVVVRARADTASSVTGLGLRFNLREGRRIGTEFQSPYQFVGQSTRLVRDGTVQTYRLRVQVGARAFRGPWRQLALWFWTEVGKAGSVELLSVTAVPAGAVYADAPSGVRAVTLGDRMRRTLYVHAPARFSYRVRVPEGGRLDAGLGVLSDDDSVTFRVTVRAGGEEETFLEERYADPGQWAQRSVDLAKFAGQTVTLTLETSAAQPGTVALWGAPTVSGDRSSTRPNVIFYVIDGGGADQMSAYGYNRRTTPNLEWLAGQGALFEHAYSNASWTKPSTTSFMTSLQNSVLGNVGGQQSFEALPPEARTMAERFHEAGYPTAVFTSNPWAGAASNLDRAVDLMRDGGVTRDYTSSVELQENYWAWRDAYPAQPYWAHIQTTDVHEYERGQPAPVAPFSGMYVTAGRRREFWAEWDRIEAAGPNLAPYRMTGVEDAGVDRVGFFETMRSLYDESMAHQDYQLGRLVERLRERGEWENTLLIIAADHAITAALWDLGALLQDTVPPPWSEPILRSSISRVPLIFVWPGHIAGGQRFSQPVSMIDVLPTVLELAGLPLPETLQGQSLAPLLLGRAGWHSRPVIFDEFVKDLRSGELGGRIEMIDGRWGASLWIGPPRDTLNRRPTPLLLFDVWNDPLALTLMNDRHPELVTKYTELLEKQWEAHRLLAQRFTAGGKVELTPEQLETLRALGYIR